MANGLSCGAIARSADAIAETYAKAAAKGVKFHTGYVEAATRCAAGSKTITIKFLRSGWVPTGTATRTYGSSCIGIVTLLTSLHNLASEAVLNQQAVDSRFCHAASYNRMRELVAAVLETTGQGKLTHPGSGFSLSGTVRRLTIAPPLTIEPAAPVEPTARIAKPLLTIRR